MANVDLNTLAYSEFNGRPLEWSVDGLVFGQINLFVGKNATGKTRVVNIVAGLAKLLLRNQIAISDANYDATFVVDGKELRYVIRVDQRKVIEEKVWFDGTEKLIRTNNQLHLFYEKQRAFIDHEPSDDEVSAAARKDRHQHPFLMPLNSWADSVRHYTFGERLGKDKLAIRVDSEKPIELDDRDQANVVAIFAKGKIDFGDAYTNAVLADMRGLDYPLLEIAVATPEHITVMMQLGTSPFQLPTQVTAIGVREDGIGGMYYQDAMSQGMFRALSVLAQVNYSQMSQRAHCVLIDDISEGLDYERSALLIDMLRQKAKQSKLQLLMSTNDQFVMNHVPLDEWSVLQRKGNHVAVKNIHNSRKAFEDFRFVGMSNFSFFEMDFANEEGSDDRQLILDGPSGDE